MNRVKLMRRAWKIKRELKTTMSMALKKSWAEMKGLVKKSILEIGTLWEKYGKKRVYFSQDTINELAVENLTDNYSVNI